jgi:prepilin-type N-terminal cleavage/methylation domain-containing protein
MNFKNNKPNFLGSSLIELMVVIAIIAFLAMIAVPNMMRYLAKAKRAEAYVNLGSIYTAQKMYWAEHGHYATKLSGKDGLGWKPEGYTGGGTSERFYYSYGFGSGSEGEHYFTGKLEATMSSLQLAKADKDSFLVLAAADIDGDDKQDIIGINEKHEIIIIQDDLQD